MSDGDLGSWHKLSIPSRIPGFGVAEKYPRHAENLSIPSRIPVEIPYQGVVADDSIGDWDEQLGGLVFQFLLGFQKHPEVDANGLWIVAKTYNFQFLLGFQPMVEACSSRSQKPFNSFSDSRVLVESPLQPTSI
jgi:hypothetical protein